MSLELLQILLYPRKVILEGIKNLSLIMLDDSSDFFIESIKIVVEFVVMLADLIFEGNVLLRDEGAILLVGGTYCSQIFQGDVAQRHELSTMQTVWLHTLTMPIIYNRNRANNPHLTPLYPSSNDIHHTSIWIMLIFCVTYLNI